jgi:hypothetical protein
MLTITSKYVQKKEILLLELRKKSLICEHKFSTSYLCRNRRLFTYVENIKDLVLCYLIHPRLDHADIGRPEHRPHRDPLPPSAAQFQDQMLKGLGQKMD